MLPLGPAPLPPPRRADRRRGFCDAWAGKPARREACTPTPQAGAADSNACHTSMQKNGKRADPHQTATRNKADDRTEAQQKSVFPAYPWRRMSAKQSLMENGPATGGPPDVHRRPGACDGRDCNSWKFTKTRCPPQADDQRHPKIGLDRRPPLGLTWSPVAHSASTAQSKWGPPSPPVLV